MKVLSHDLNNQFFNELPDTLTSLKIISPYISKFNVEQLLERLKKYDEDIEITVITTFDRNNFLSGASSLQALQLLLEHRIAVYSLNNLHTKLYIFNERKCIVGSANFTKKGFQFNHELLIVINEPSETESIVVYANDLLTNIKDNGNWLVTTELIEQEEIALQEINFNETLLTQQSWGANLIDQAASQSIVLSVSAGATINLIEAFLIHSHPIKRGYNYKDTDLIAFREENGGAMSHVYKVLYTVNINMNDWQDYIEKSNIAPTYKLNLINYINSRIRDYLGFDSVHIYKFYILEKHIPLPNKPRPIKNNTGGRYYSLKDLMESNLYVQHYPSKKINLAK